jgi:hypothetical protein
VSNGVQGQCEMKATTKILSISPNHSVDLAGSNPVKDDAPEQLDVRSFQKALDKFCADTRTKFEERFPGMAYDSSQYDFKKDSGKSDAKGNKLTLQALYGTKAVLSRPDLVEVSLCDLHPSFVRATRSVLAHRLLQKQNKDTEKLEYGLRLLAHLESLPTAERPTELHELTPAGLRHIEKCVLTGCLSPQFHEVLKKNGQRIDHLVVDSVVQRGADALNNRRFLQLLHESVGLLASRGTLPADNFKLSHEVSDILKLIERHQTEAYRESKSAELEPGISALSEAIIAMVNEDARLTPVQQAVLSVMGLEMCAPSRINEILTMSIHDRLVSLDAYKEEPLEEPQAHETADASRMEQANAALRVRKTLHQAHSGIREASEPNPMDALPNTILMKGSKGAAWGSKPVLDFMLTMFNDCFDRLVSMGARSRMLLEHYERSPDKLYLPPSLEHYRGKALNRAQIGRVMLLDGDMGSTPDEIKAKYSRAEQTAMYVCRDLKAAGLQFRQSVKPEVASRIVDDRGALGLYKQDIRTEYSEWSAIEAELLRRVRAAIHTIPWVSEKIRYQGRLSSMLMLFDHQERTPDYLPGSLSAQEVAKRLKPRVVGSQTVFEALDIKMPIRRARGNGPGKDAGVEIEYVPAYCRTHDPRRWLTTMALRHGGPQLTRLMVNMWTNRADVGQLPKYDYQTQEERADRAVLDVPPELKDLGGLNEAKDMSAALTAELAGEYGLKTQLMRVGTHVVHATTMDAIHAASTDRPVARAGSKVIIIRPTPYGVCLMQAHEGGCTNYRGCASGCDDQRFVKGHLPTNESARQEERRLHDIIVAQVRQLILARNREVVHDLPGLGSQISEMVRQHMNVPEVARRLIEQFHEIKHVIKDAAFRADLESAHVFGEVVKILDSDKYTAGALIHYMNPEINGRPERERSIELLGGRAALAQRIEGFTKNRTWLHRDPEQAALGHEAANDGAIDALDSEDDFDEHEN